MLLITQGILNKKQVKMDSNKKTFIKQGFAIWCFNHNNWWYHWLGSLKDPVNIVKTPPRDLTMREKQQKTDGNSEKTIDLFCLPLMTTHAAVSVITRSFQGAHRGFFLQGLERIETPLLLKKGSFSYDFCTFCVSEGRMNFQPYWIGQGGLTERSPLSSLQHHLSRNTKNLNTIRRFCWLLLMKGANPYS